MKRVPLFFGIGLLVGLLGTYGFFINQAHAPETTVITYGTEKLQVEIANTDEARVRGLSGRAQIGTDGMLFVFPTEEYVGIWMKDMRFAIDIIWMNSNGEVVTIFENITPETYPTVFTPQEPARYVLEIPAGMAQNLGIATGTTFILPQ